MHLRAFYRRRDLNPYSLFSRGILEVRHPACHQKTINQESWIRCDR
jgi:hypothetical protein